MLAGGHIGGYTVHACMSRMFHFFDSVSQEEILSNVDVEVPAGARAVIVGPNGCGKTTLLTTIANRDSVEGATQWLLPGHFLDSRPFKH